MSFYSEKELKGFGLKKCGKNVLISKKASLYGANNIAIGDNTRIDDFTIVSATGGSVVIGSHIHIASHCLLVGGGGIIISDFCGISSFTSIYSASDDYSGQNLVGPIIDADLICVDKSKVILGQYVVCGTHSVILPGVTMREGSVLGACSLTSRDLDEWQIYAGRPAKKLKPRNRDLIGKSKIMEARWKERIDRRRELE